MNRLVPRVRSVVVGAVASVVAIGACAAAPVAQAPSAPSLVHTIQADCYSIGQQVADDRGGRLGNVRSSTQGGKEVCIIVVLLPAKDGQRPQTERVVVPAK